MTPFVYLDWVPHMNILFHPNLKFTSELGPSVLPYWETSISLPTTMDGNFTSKVFRKPTYTGLILNFSAICPQKWKKRSKMVANVMRSRTSDVQTN